MICFKYAYINWVEYSNNDLFPAIINDRVIRVYNLSTIINDPTFLSTTLFDLDNSCKFVICIDVEPSFDNLLVLTRLTFQTNYHKSATSLRVFVYRNEKFKVEEHLRSQGFDQVDIIELSELLPISIGRISGLTSRNIGIDVGNSFIYIKSFDFAKNKINGLSNDLIMILGYNIDLTARINELEDIITVLSLEKKSLSTELENHKTYLSIALKQKETERILNFYHNEYEVLPLWYKRIGHIIKVLMGKRKLKSFLAANNSKY